MMPQQPKSPTLLRRLKVREVSSVDVGAGHNCEVILSKRDDDADPLEVLDAVFADAVSDIIADTGISVAEKIGKFQDEFAGYVDATTEEEPTYKLLNDVLAEHAEDESNVVQLRAMPTHADAERKARDRRAARALAEERAQRQRSRLKKENEMTTVQDVAKAIASGAPAGDVTRKMIYAEIVKLAETYRESHPDLSPAQCFDKVATKTPEGRTLFAAHRVMHGPDCDESASVPARKAAPTPPCGPALMQLNSLATQHRAAHPKLSQAQAFSHVYQAPENRGLVGQHKQEARAAAMA
jgi:hypothetical protein